jgi:hypothetical protein
MTGTCRGKILDGITLNRADKLIVDEEPSIKGNLALVEGVVERLSVGGRHGEDFPATRGQAKNDSLSATL